MDAGVGRSACLVVFSGGADSTICLHWALSRFIVSEAVTFDYGQRHRVEIDSAREICSRLGVSHNVVPMECLRHLGGNSLVDQDLPVSRTGRDDLPNTFVPGRNLLFLTLAAARAYQLGAHELVGGMCQTDSSGYPDCREAAIRSLEESLNLGMAYRIRLHTPLMHLSKAESVRLARELGAFDSLALSHSCYEGARPPCGICPSCELRAKGFAEAGFTDPLLARLGLG